MFNIWSPLLLISHHHIIDVKKRKPFFEIWVETHLFLAFSYPPRPILQNRCNIKIYYLHKICEQGFVLSATRNLNLKSDSESERLLCPKTGLEMRWSKLEKSSSVLSEGFGKEKLEFRVTGFGKANCCCLLVTVKCEYLFAGSI